MNKNQEPQLYLIILGAGPQQEKIYTLALKLGHRIIGIDLDYETVGSKGGMLMVAASGTAIKL